MYFSDKTRNFYPQDFVDSYRGVLLLMLRHHIQFRIVTPRTLADFHQQVLILPDVRVLSDAESTAIHNFAGQGGRVVLTGHADPKLSDLSSAQRFPDAPERAYLHAAAADFGAPDTSAATDFLNSLHLSAGKVTVTASRNVVVHVAASGPRTYIFLANFDGLKPGEIATPRTQHDVQISVEAPEGTQLHVLPFLGKESLISGKPTAGKLNFKLPALERGAVAWIE